MHIPYAFKAGFLEDTDCISVEEKESKTSFQVMRQNHLIMKFQF